MLRSLFKVKEENGLPFNTNQQHRHSKAHIAVVVAPRATPIAIATIYSTYSIGFRTHTATIGTTVTLKCGQKQPAMFSALPA